MSNTRELLGAKDASPEYIATMDLVPAPNELVSFACPSISVTVPNNTVPFFMNVIVPVGVPDGEETAAVKVSGWSTAGVFDVAVRVADVGYPPTPWSKTAEVFAGK